MTHRCDGFRQVVSTARPLLVAVDLDAVSIEAAERDAERDVA